MLHDMYRLRSLWAVPLLCLSLNGFAATLLPVHGMQHSQAQQMQPDHAMAQLQHMAMGHTAENCCPPSHAATPPHASNLCANHCAMVCFMLALPVTQLQLLVPYSQSLMALIAPQPSAAHRRALLRPPSTFIA